ncbi:von Willebrand factor type A domain-containing protein [[Phormidium] sp. ETS-05]|uniref:YfbK domain-containing protein n=1 Tax=[Phormidium] sp. ETS-05 TaxID=222819 RepID=UPI0018EEDE58|nr:von Willebrand factor type A domain-containing protein [[Phormidium] sp. ETS-05]
MGILGAVALPSLFSQTNKSKQVEGRNNIGAMNRAQQAYNLDKSGFSTAIPPLQEDTTETSNTEEYDTFDENHFQLTSTKPFSTFSIDVDTASYSNVRRFLNEGVIPPKDAVRIEELINYFDYDYPQPEGDYPFAITTEISQAPWNSGHKLVHIGLQGKTIQTENLPPSNLVFLLDVSGSMSDHNKLPLVKSALRLLVNNLTEKDRVSIVVYAGAAGLVLPPTPGNQKRQILKAIDDLNAGGSTAGGEGIRLAYEVASRTFISSGNNRVILATDGDFNVGVSSDDELVRLIESYRDRDIFLSVLGFGMGNLKDSKMEKLADKGNGNYAYIDNQDEAKKVLVSEMASTLVTIAKDVKIQVEFNPDQVKAYRLIGYENRQLRTQDFQDDTKDAGELGPGHSVTALYEIIPVGTESDINLPDDSLRYQQQTIAPKSDFSNELMMVNLRYKAPSGTTSHLIEHPVLDLDVRLADTSDNFKWAAAVAEFGMILRDSQDKGQANFDDVLHLANQSKGADLPGYRSEFIRLVETSKNLKTAEANMGDGGFAGSMTQLGVGIPTDTVNYHYAIRRHNHGVFNYAIPKNPGVPGYVGSVWEVFDNTTGEKSSRSILCEAKSPVMNRIPDPIYQNGGFICPPGTKSLGN